jgi:Tol biopolymer transport system component
MRNETTEGIALSPDGKLLAVSLMRDSPGNSAPTIQVLNLATGATRTWTAPTRNYPYLVGPPSWVDGSRVIAFTWLNADQSGLMAAPRGIRLLDITAPGDNLVAGKLIVPSGVVAAGSIVSALITPDGRDLIVVTWRDLTPQASTHTVVVQFAELQASTGRLVRLLRTQTERYDEVHVVTVEGSLGVLSLGPQGRYALVQGVTFGWLDLGGPDPGRFTPLPALPAGQYVNFAAW